MRAFGERMASVIKEIPEMDLSDVKKPEASIKRGEKGK